MNAPFPDGLQTRFLCETKLKFNEIENVFPKNDIYRSQLRLPLGEEDGKLLRDDPRDYPLRTLLIVHENLSVELSMFWGFSNLIVGPKVTTEPAY